MLPNNKPGKTGFETTENYYDKTEDTCCSSTCYKSRKRVFYEGLLQRIEKKHKLIHHHYIKIKKKKILHL